jgi:GNAT superfamily N-acetyltransferase
MRRAVVEVASRADVPGVIELIGRVFAEYGFLYDPVAEVPDLLDFERHYQPPRGEFFVFRHGGAVAGSVGIERIGDSTAEIHRLYLDAALRGRGTGRVLVEAALDWCRTHGVSDVILWSDTRFDRAHRLYDRMGFRQTGHRIVPGDANQSQEYRFERAVSLGPP